MVSTLLRNDIEVLLKDVSDTVSSIPVEEREKFIGLGKKAYEMVPFESAPSKDEILIYEKVLELSAEDTASAVSQVAEKIYEKQGKDVVLVSLIRGGIPAGILIKRYLERKYNIKIRHFAVTLIGTMGIDEKALEYIINEAGGNKIQFIDGWTGKGAVNNMLNKSLEKYKHISYDLAVLADPANLLNLYGTHEDILIPSACLNSTLSGLISRAIPLENSFFGAIFFKELIEYDRTYHFIDTIDKKLEKLKEVKMEDDKLDISGLDEVKDISKSFDIPDIHFIKPGCGETMRALIRKKPDLVLIKNEENKYTSLMREIAIKNQVEVRDYPLKRYNACGLYKDINSDVL